MRFRIELNNSISYLEIFYDGKDTGGYYLYQVNTDGSGYDNWFETLEQAYRHAELNYGVSRNEWRLIE